MIDPKEFLNKDKKQEVVLEDSIEISGTFICQECNESIHKAKLNEDKRKIVWVCSEGHNSEARL